MEKFLSVDEVSVLTGYKPYTIRKRVRDGKLRAYRWSPGSQMKFKESDIMNFLKPTTLINEAK